MTIFHFGLAFFVGGLRCRSTSHKIEPVATSQNIAIQTPNQVPLYQGFESTGVGVGVSVGVDIGVTVAVGVVVGDIVGVYVVSGVNVGVIVEVGTAVGLEVAAGVGV